MMRKLSILTISLLGLASFIQAAPIPRDIDLPLPLDEWTLKFLLVILFLAHIFFINLMLGGAVLSVIFEMVGRKFPHYDALGKKISETVTVNKSIAVVLGVGPLLCINLAYTTHFYSANALTGLAWISVIPLVIIAFLLAYLHKYTWDKWTGEKKPTHILVGLSAALIFLFVPLIFLANINLMLFPADWQGVRGFFSSLRVGNVFPRYFHFLTASLAVTSLILAWWYGRKKYPVEKFLPGFTHEGLRRLFYRLTFYATAAQLVFGPLLLFTLPYEGITTWLLIIVGLVIILAIGILHLLRREIKVPNEKIGRMFIPVLLTLTLVVLLMGTARHLYREACLVEHTRLIADRSQSFQANVIGTQMRLAAGLDAGAAVGGGPTGEKLFINCAACHALNKVLAAPSLVEVYSLYKDNPEGIVTWAKNPGKKRPEFAPMPSFAHLGDEKLRLVADYILEMVSGSGVSILE